MIDIIIPVKGRPSKLGRALHSLEQQTCRSFEVTVVNDHSSQEERADISRICSEYNGVINLIDSRGTGAPAANHRLQKHPLEARHEQNTRGKTSAWMDAKSTRP